MPTYPPLWTSQQIANHMTRDGAHWAGSTVTYSFNNESTAGNALNATFQTWVTRAVQMVEELIGVDFVLTAGAGDITFNGSANNGTYAASGWQLPSRAFTSADIFFDQTWSSNQAASLAYGSYGFTTILHEFLHALGLEHPGLYNGSASYFSDAQFLQDTGRYTVMSYFDAQEDGSGTSHWIKKSGSWQQVNAQTPMVYDMLALTDGGFDGVFSGYAANAATRAGATTYGYNATAGINQVFNFATNLSPVLAIYDAGGVDTLDLSSDTIATRRIVTYNAAGSAVYSEGGRTSSVIDLRDGSYSSTHGMSNNIGIAFGTVIENAVGTGFNDTIIGNSAGNLLRGGAGNDFLLGGAGADTLNGGAGADWFAFTSNGGVSEGDVIQDYSSSDFIYFGGTSASPVFSLSGSNVIANFVTLTGAAAANVTVITQILANLVNLSDFAAMNAALTSGIAAVYSHGAYSSTVFDADSNEAWWTVESGYNPMRQLDYVNTVYDSGQSHYALFSNLDEGQLETWSLINSYFSTAGAIDFNWISYDSGQPYYGASDNFDELAAQTWSHIQTFYSAQNVVDFSWNYYDSGQPFSAASVDYDQTGSHTWANIQTFFTTPGVVDFSWAYYDAGQALYAAVSDYDQAGDQAWSSIQTFYSAPGVVDFVWSYYDAGQTVARRLVDYDQANANTWNQHVIEYGASNSVLNDYYI